MNFLAHLLLADDSPASRIGNLLGDFTRGTMDKLEKIYPPEVARGIRMHRAVDSFTDAHTAFKASRTLLAPDRRRFAGIIVDLIFDHFLSVHWKDYHLGLLEDFCQQVYQEIEDHPEWQARRLAVIHPIMKRENWLMRYSTMEGMEVTLDEISYRSPRIRGIQRGFYDFQKNYSGFESNFHIFMPALVEFVEKWKQENP